MALSPAQRLADSREKDETLSALVACITAAGLSLDDKQLKTIEDWISSEGITGTALASAFTGTIVPKLHGLSYSVSLAIFAAFRGESIGGAGNRAGNQQFVIPNSNNTPDTPNVHHGARIAARSLLDVLGLDFARFQNVHGVPSVDEIVSGTTITGSTEPFAPTPFLVSESITGMNVALGVLANIISKMRFGHTQHVTVNVNHASASLSTHCNMWLDGNHYKQLIRAAAAAQENPHREFMQLFQNTFRAKNGWVYMYQRATDTPEGLLEGLGFPKEDIPRIYQLTKTSSETRHEFLRLLSDKIYSWPSALELEQHMIKLGRGAVVVPKSDEEFRESEHGKIAVNFPPIEILPQEQPGANWLPQPFEKLAGSQGKGPLSGIKVLEVTRILMGPQITCVLAGLGASVLRVSSKQLEDGKTVAMCLNVGKRSVYLDLKSEEGKRIFTSLVADADVVVQKGLAMRMVRWIGLDSEWKDS
ncbi:hypothetical protein M427DRAFT_314415 [Gonapodya prolifera JEL478]|uniref:CoA-transferase family III n=1 Tax=Gonapodya prolifera (strain JEL478) TaxID=1344416 RepID=A0A139AXF0_GONPJ|nr:hypothetical protein M427DRAFT_314415 [Gonapodya prolifera JEL478]|eukprot:KXS21253.1 hypothetical protein M427DRAFT_314415 [Gonapodya prolifera JEL478]